MKKFLFFLFLTTMSLQGFAVGTTVHNDWAQGVEGIYDLTSETPNLSMDEFLSLTPKKYKKMTGKKLGLKNTLILKAAQKQIKKKGVKATDIPQGLYVVMAIFGWAWLAMGLMDDWSGNNWWVCLLLYFLCGLPGIIYALVKMKDYY